MNTPSYHVPKKILFCGFQQAHLKQCVAEFLGEHDFDLVGLMANDNYLGSKADVFLRYKDTRRNYHFEDHTHKEVPSREIIESMRSTEAQALKMMDRNYRSPFKPLQYEFRKRAYLAQLTYAYGFLIKHGFDHVIFSNIPHNSFDYILFNVCKALNIKSSFFYQLQVKDSFIHSYDIDTLFDPLALPDDYKEQNHDDLPEYLENEITARLNLDVPFYMNPKRTPLRDRLMVLYKKAFRIKTYTTPIYTISSWFAYTRIKKFKPADDTQFVYFALHMQPEATTSPMGGIFVDQYYAILMIARSMPENVKVLIKEHPAQQLWRRSANFYRILDAEPNVEFVDLKENSFQLIEKSLAVATITGTVGWEALFLKKPVILFGNIFYKHLPGVINVNSTQGVTDAINDVLAGNFQPCELSDIRAILHRTHEIAYTGCVDDDYFAETHMELSEHHESVKQALRDHLAH